MDEAQKIRDRKIRGNRLLNRLKNEIKIKSVKNIIKDLECHGPAGLIHIIVLSNIVRKPILIWNIDGTLNRIIGKKKSGEPIHIEYHTTGLERIGHWTLKQARDPDNIDIDLNSCLFSVIGSQIGRNPSELRKQTVLKMKSNLRQLSKWLDEILPLRQNNNETVMMIGGARYRGNSPNDAKIVLDKSQNAPCYMGGRLNPPLGHPRGHASHPAATGEMDSVENYSKYSRKTGFLSRDDQDRVIHLALSTREAQEAMTLLNEGAITMKVEISAAQLNIMQRNNHLPKAKEYYGSVAITNEMDIKKVLMILRHHLDRYKDRDADVMIHTCYPIIY